MNTQNLTPEQQGELKELRYMMQELLNEMTELLNGMTEWHSRTMKMRKVQALLADKKKLAKMSIRQIDAMQDELDGEENAPTTIQKMDEPRLQKFSSAREIEAAYPRSREAPQ